MEIEISPKKLHGNIAAISSKSDGHRCLIAAALADKPTEIHMNLISKDIEATSDCLASMGAGISINDSTIQVVPIDFSEASPVLNCRESGSTLRFLLPVAAAICSGAKLIGEGRLPFRPLSPLIEELEKKGSKFSSKTLPIDIGGTLSGGIYSLPGNISSQYITGLLFALPLLKENSTISLTTPLESSGYVDMTLNTLKHFGIKIETFSGGYHIPGNQKYISPGTIDIEGDWSNSAFWLTGKFLGSNISVSGLNNESCQGDRMIHKVLRELKDGYVIDGRDIPDLVPIISVAACGICGSISIINISRLKLKESDRIESVKQMISSLGGQVITNEDSITIKGTGRLKGGQVDSFNDHRIAMASAIASCICDNNVIIYGAEAVNKSYPGFFEHFNSLGGNAHVVQLRK